MDTQVVRLIRGQDIKRELDAQVRRFQWPAGCILCAVGSLNPVVLRFAGQSSETRVPGCFEIVSLCGTLGDRISSHLHLAVSDGTGKTIGGHLKEGALIHTTAEVVIARLDGWRFSRPFDESTGHPELKPEML